MIVHPFPTPEHRARNALRIHGKNNPEVSGFESYRKRAFQTKENEKYKIIKRKTVKSLGRVGAKVFCQLCRSKFVTGRVAEMAKPCQSALAGTLRGMRKPKEGWGEGDRRGGDCANINPR